MKCLMCGDTRLDALRSFESVNIRDSKSRIVPVPICQSCIVPFVAWLQDVGESYAAPPGGLPYKTVVAELHAANAAIRLGSWLLGKYEIC